MVPLLAELLPLPPVALSVPVLPEEIVEVSPPELLPLRVGELPPLPVVVCVLPPEVPLESQAAGRNATRLKVNGPRTKHLKPPVTVRG